MKAKTRRQRQRLLISQPPNKAASPEPERGQRGQGRARRKPRQTATSRHLRGGTSPDSAAFPLRLCPGPQKPAKNTWQAFFVPWPAKKLFTIRKWSARSACGLLSHAARAWTGFQRPDAPLLAEMSRCQLAASMVTHDVTEAVACPAPLSAWSASLASALPADGGAPPPRLPPARAAEGKLKKGCCAASPACAASWRIHGPMRVSQ